MQFEKASDIRERIEEIIDCLRFTHIDKSRIVCMRGYGSKGRAVARVWNFPKIWQRALEIKPFYVIEVICPKFDKLSKEDQDRTLVHELMHIPKTFSGGLVPHKCFGKRIDNRNVEKLYKEYLKNKQ